MTEHLSQLTSSTEVQRERALERFSLIQPFLKGDVPLTHLAEMHHLSLRTLRLWVKQYRLHGLIGLVRKRRSDRGKRRGLPVDLVSLIEGLALQKPKRSIAAIHRQITKIALDRGWPQPSYGCVHDIICSLDPALVTMAHEGAIAYREDYDLLYRREASHSNAHGLRNECCHEIHSHLRFQRGSIR